jgi:hypothetical protein
MSGAGSSSGEWGPWIKHDGRSVPLPDGTVCWVECAARVAGVVTVSAEVPAGGNCWIWDSIILEAYIPLRIVRYRIRRPDALRELIDLVENLPAPAPGERVQS